MSKKLKKHYRKAQLAIQTIEILSDTALDTLDEEYREALLYRIARLAKKERRRCYLK